MSETLELDPAELEQFGEKMLGILNGGMAATMISIGHQVGLFDTMAQIPHAATSAEIAEAAGLDERYVREWLGAMATAGIVEYEPGRAGFKLPPEHAAMTTRAAGPNNFACFITRRTARWARPRQPRQQANREPPAWPRGRRSLRGSPQ